MEEKTPIFIMHNVPREKLSEVMRAVKSVLGNDVIFSITTETNINWKVNDLLEELILEHREMQKLKKQQ